MQAERFPHLEEVLSHERFGTYRRWANDNRDEAIELYSLNSRLSAAFYIPLQMLEVALRNRIDHVLRQTSGELWFELPTYQAIGTQAQMIRSVYSGRTVSGQPMSTNSIIASLTFGYWTSFFGREYEDLWQASLHKIARRENGKGLRRKDFSVPLASIRLLRNRIAHHEPILHWDLKSQHDSILQLTRWLSPVAAEWTKAHCWFDVVLPVHGIVLHGR